MGRVSTSLVVVALVVVALAGGLSPVAAQQVGPASGTLVLVGGNLQDPAIVERFLELAGGPDASIVLVPTAGGETTYDQEWSGADPFRAAGATRLTILHTIDPDTANTDAFVAPLRDARGVWFGGGRQWRLADAYLDTKVHEALREVLDRGGVIGGSSAGATILGSYLVRGDTRTNAIMMGDHEEGFGLLRGVGVDQHLLRRNRQFDLIDVIRTRPDLLGIGIDEDTAIVVQGDRFEVIGRSYVAIYDHERLLDSGGLFYLLAPGDAYDLATREAYRPRPALGPLGRVVAGPWPAAPR